jgi:hypothetical protein
LSHKRRLFRIHKLALLVILNCYLESPPGISVRDLLESCPTGLTRESFPPAIRLPSCHPERSEGSAVRRERLHYVYILYHTGEPFAHPSPRLRAVCLASTRWRRMHAQ